MRISTLKRAHTKERKRHTHTRWIHILFDLVYSNSSGHRFRAKRLKLHSAENRSNLQHCDPLLHSSHRPQNIGGKKEAQRTQTHTRRKSACKCNAVGKRRSSTIHSTAVKTTTTTTNYSVQPNSVWATAQKLQPNCTGINFRQTKSFVVYWVFSPFILSAEAKRLTFCILFTLGLCVHTRLFGLRDCSRCLLGCSVLKPFCCLMNLWCTRLPEAYNIIVVHILQWGFFFPILLSCLFAFFAHIHSSST